MTKIKILQGTHCNKKGDVLTIEQFRANYPALRIVKINSEELCILPKSDYSLIDFIKSSGSDWFEVIEEPKFKIGDWVWNEILQKAFNVIDWNIDTIMKPNECTISAANTYPDVYKRHANSDEIKYYTLHLFCDDTVLIGQSECYYFDHIWKPIIKVEWNVNKYIQTLKEFRIIEVLNSKNDVEKSYQTRLNGLKVGCKHISHEEVIQIAKILKLIP